MRMYFVPRHKIRLFSMAAVVLVMLLSGFWLFEWAVPWRYGGSAMLQGPPPGAVTLVVRIPDRALEVYTDGKLYKRYRIAVGRTDTPTPVGEWVVVYKSYSPKEIYGTRWLGLDVPWGSYGIHGTNMPWSIGSFASQGCIRLRNRDVEELYEWVPLGTPVTVKGRMVPVERPLRYDTVGPDVVTLQLRLVELGYLQERADGKFGRETEAAVRAFQRDHGLAETGITDWMCLKALGLTEGSSATGFNSELIQN